MLDDAFERIVTQDSYADVSCGIFVIRGENVMLMGEIDKAKERILRSSLRRVSAAEARNAIARGGRERTRGGGDQLEWPIHDEY